MLDRNVHKTVLLQILKEIYTDTTLGPILGFKGGTAAFLFYDLGRFSLDLDFDLLDEHKEDYIFDKVQIILKNFGTIKDRFRKLHTLLYVLSYADHSRNIKVEINKRSFGSRYELKQYLGISMLVMVREDMFAHKLVAMLDRTVLANRDIYDVWFFLKNHWPINETIVQQRVGVSLQEHLQRCIALIEKLSDKNILAGIGELLDHKQKAWAKTNLRKDVLFLLRLRLEDSHLKPTTHLERGNVHGDAS